LRRTLNYRASATIVLSGTPPAALVTTCVNSGQRVILINRDDHIEGPINVSVDNASERALYAARWTWAPAHRQRAGVSGCQTRSTNCRVARQRSHPCAQVSWSTGLEAHDVPRGGR